MALALKTEGVDEKDLARRLRIDLDRKETKLLKIKGGIIDWSKYLPESSQVVQDQQSLYRVIASSAEETLIALEVDALGIQVDAREDAQKLLGLYVTKVELSGPDGGPIKYGDIPEDEREILLKLTRDYEKELNKKSAREAKSGRKGAGKAQPRKGGSR